MIPWRRCCCCGVVSRQPVAAAAAALCGDHGDDGCSTTDRPGRRPLRGTGDARYRRRRVIMNVTSAYHRLGLFLSLLIVVVAVHSDTRADKGELVAVAKCLANVSAATQLLSTGKTVVTTAIRLSSDVESLPNDSRMVSNRSRIV